MDSLNPIDWATYYNRLIVKTKCQLPDDCAVCLQAVLNTTVTYLPCKHYFHTSCINQTFDTKMYTCPLCRYSLTHSLQQADYHFTENENDLWSHFFDSFVYPNIDYGTAVFDPAVVAAARQPDEAEAAFYIIYML